MRITFHFLCPSIFSIERLEIRNYTLINKIKSEMRNKIKELQIRTRNSGLENQK